MDINIKDILTLNDNNEYIVVSKINYENRNYYYLLNKNNYNNKKFCYEEKNELVEITDQAFIIKLLPLLLNPMLNEIKNIEEN